MTFDPIICRSCLKANGEMINLFTEIADTDGELTLSDCFNICTNIKVENDSSGMPDTICEDCLGELKVAFTFRSKCEKSDYVLRNQLLKTELKYEINENYGQEMVIEVLTDDIGYMNNPVEINNFTKVQETHGDKDTQKHIPNTKWLIQQRPEKSNDIPDDEIEEIFLNDDLSKIDDEENDGADIDDNIPLVTFASSRKIDANNEERLNNTTSFNAVIIVEEPLNKQTGNRCRDSKEQVNVVNKVITQNRSTGHDQNVSLKNWFECDQCKKGFTLKGTLEKHMQTVHSGKILHLCNFCGKMCSNEASLKSHMLQHRGERPYECPQCPKTYFTKNGLMSHQSVHTNKKPDAKFLCSICGKGFTTNQRLRIHTFTHTGERNFACDLCEKSFATEFRLRSHRRTHTGERPYQCQDCGLSFAQGNALKCHKRVHTGEKPYVCKFCNKRFTQNTILKTHMTLHTGKTVKCPECDKKFSRASYLILHRREHTGEKPYVCDRCPNRYKQKSHLDRHMDTHLGVKHRCEICGKEYSKQWSLKMHMFVHADVKPFNCNQCSISFIRKDKYKAHLKVHHGQTLMEDQKAALIIVDQPTQYVRIEEICDTSTPPTVTTVISTIPVSS